MKASIRREARDWGAWRQTGQLKAGEQRDATSERARCAAEGHNPPSELQAGIVRQRKAKAAKHVIASTITHNIFKQLQAQVALPRLAPHVSN